LQHELWKPKLGFSQDQHSSSKLEALVRGKYLKCFFANVLKNFVLAYSCTGFCVLIRSNKMGSEIRKQNYGE